MNINIPEQLTVIGDDLFSRCSSLSNVSIPNSVTSIGSSAFEECTSLANVTIPSSVISVGKRAFYGLADNSTIYVETQAVADLLSGKYDSSKTTVVVDPSKF